MKIQLYLCKQIYFGVQDLLTRSQITVENHIHWKACLKPFLGSTPKISDFRFGTRQSNLHFQDLGCSISVCEPGFGNCWTR